MSRACHLQWRGASGELPQSLQGGAGMPCPLLTKGTRISNSSVPPRAPGVLRPPITQFHPCLHSIYRRLCCSLRVVPGLRGSLRAVEKAILPRPSHTEGVTLSSGRSRNMAHRRYRILVRYSEEVTRRLAFRMVLYGGRSPSGPCSAGSS